MLRATARLLACLDRQSQRRTVVVSALATASTTGALPASAGQEISAVGYGIVGISTGPQLEIGFHPPGPMGPGSAMLQAIDQLTGHSTGR